MVTPTGVATRVVCRPSVHHFSFFYVTLIWSLSALGNLLPGMRRVCTLKADLSNLVNSLKVQKGPRGQDFWRVEHSVAVLFGGTQLRARLQWYEGVSCILRSEDEKALLISLLTGPIARRAGQRHPELGSLGIPVDL